MKNTVLTALAACSLFMAAPASAQLEGNPDRYCRDGYFPRESKEYRLATIKGGAGGRAYFHDDDPEKCPADPSCRLKTYVVANDQVIVSRTLGKFACSWFQPPRRGHGTTGWIETDRLKWTGSIKPPLQRDWLGEWRAPARFIRITRTRKVGDLDISGEATWGSGDRVNEGAIAYTATPSGDTMKFGDGTGQYDCQVDMQLVGKFLIVGDNLNCGGHNVSFSGVYRKRR